MTPPAAAAFTLPDTDVVLHRLGYGTMRLPGKNVTGPPEDKAAALAVLREAVAQGVNHLDTADFYGPGVSNALIREALSPYPPGLTIVTKVGARRPPDGSWKPIATAEELTASVHNNLRELGVEVLDVVNLRLWGDGHGPSESSVEARLAPMMDLQRKGLIRHLGLSNCTRAQVAEARAMTPLVCVQNQYNLAHREDDTLVDELAAAGIAYVPFFPLGGFSPLQSSTLDDAAKKVGATPMQVALAWLLQRSSNILLIPGTSSVEHLRENLKAASLTLPADTVTMLDGIAAGK